MNVLVDKHGIAKLCDFGLTRLPSWQGPAGMTTTTPYTGTTSYKAPELFPSAESRLPVATYEGDIYSLGCIMLEVRDSPDDWFVSDEFESVH
jgi:serine/threonine protein kinase